MVGYFTTPLTKKPGIKPGSVDVIVITGHPATGKTTLARHIATELRLLLVCRDQIKETLLDTLGWSTDAWSRQLSAAAWTLLYQQVEGLLQADIAHVVESNFDPVYANAHWQQLAKQYPLHLIQVRCETDSEVLIQRYRERVRSGDRHPGHVDQSDDPAFLALLRRGPMPWIDVPGPRIRVDASDLATFRLQDVLRSINQNRTE